MEKIITKLRDIKKTLEDLKQKHHAEGKEEFSQVDQVIQRIIDRIYPEKDAMDLKHKMHRNFFVCGDSTDAEDQENYLYNLDLVIKVVTTILEEYELFGFDDFKPLKEKTETEWQVGSDKFGFFKKKKTK